MAEREPAGKQSQFAFPKNPEIPGKTPILSGQIGLGGAADPLGGHRPRHASL